MIYDVIIVGTGFGATIAASRMAKLKKKVLMLDRGSWWITPKALGMPPAPLRREEEVLAALGACGVELGDREYANAIGWMRGPRGRLHQVVTKIPPPGPPEESVDQSRARLGSLGPDKDSLYLDRSRALRDA